ncbi:MAG: flagellar basal body P-ring formation chaperone FlgA, partial [Leptothrix sp. (in: b-proteobacteria)]
AWAGVGLLLSGMLGAMPALAQTQTQTQTQTAAPAPAAANSTLPMAEVLSLARSQAQAPVGSRIEVVPGQLDPRLRLAPCERIQAYLPAGSRPWGQTRVGLRCTAGPVAWNVYMPVTVKVWGQALVAARALGADTPLVAADLQLAEVDLAEQASPALTQASELIGRRLVRPLAPGSTLRADALRLRQWFAPGDLVSITTRGDGFSVTSEAQALSPGLEGQSVRLRTDSGRILNAWPTGERQAEVRL